MDGAAARLEHASLVLDIVAARLGRSSPVECVSNVQAPPTRRAILQRVQTARNADRCNSHGDCLSVHLFFHHIPVFCPDE